MGVDETREFLAEYGWTLSELVSTVKRWGDETGIEDWDLVTLSSIETLLR